MAAYAFTDLHGNLKAYKRLMEYTSPEDKLFFLGDAADRGGKGFEIMLELLNDPRVTYLKGNHERMMYEAVENGSKSEEHSLWMYNGGRSTYLALRKHFPDENDRLAFAEKLNQLPVYAGYETPDGRIWHMTHAGYNFGTDVEDTEAFVWNRSHFRDDRRGADNEFQIHGHTPTFHLIPRIYGSNSEMANTYKGEAVTYADGKKICIDMLTAFTGRAVLFNLDTGEELYADVEPAQKTSLNFLVGYKSFAKHRKSLLAQ